MAITRRKFLQRTGALATMAFASSLDRFGIMNALAAPATDYKALVCIFLFGGNDGNNMVVPFETAEYNAYAAVRGGGAEPIALARNSLLSILPPSVGLQFGLHPNLSEMQPLFTQQKLAVLCNVGTLLEPLTRTQYRARSAPIPASLFSHDDQQQQWQSSQSRIQSRTGWGGRIADVTADLNGSETFPMISSTVGSTLFAAGARTSPISIPTSGGFGLQGFNSSPASVARMQALRDLLAADRENTLVNSASTITNSAVVNSAAINSIITSTTSTIPALFGTQTSSISQQLKQVARVIEARASLGLQRQIFFCSMGGFDTHNGQLAAQTNLFSQLSPALNSFYNATVQLGIQDQVTSFTLSDFGRTFKPASGGGSDHAWGNHHLIMGGAVRGGDFYGRYPTLALGGPDDAASEGRWIPTTSVDQYAATLALWYGVSPSDLPMVVPNIGRFATSNLGFLA